LNIGVAVRPVFFTASIDKSSILYTTHLNDSGTTATFTQVAQIHRIETIYNAGGDADISLSQKLSPVSWLYFRSPFEYRRYWGSSVDATTDMYSLKDSVIYRNDTVHVPSIVQTREQGHGSPDQYLASVAPHLGLMVRSNRPYNWPMAFLPFVAQYIDLEFYYKATYDDQYRNYFYSYLHGWRHDLVLSFDSYQKACVPTRWFTAIENVVHGEFVSHLRREYTYHTLSIGWTPQFRIAKNFIIEIIDLSCDVELYKHGEWWATIGFTGENMGGFSYTADTWGVAVMTPVLSKNFLNSLSFFLWKQW
jgi:hypothetical protein